MIYCINTKQLYKDSEFVIFFISRVVNSTFLPVNCGMPDDVQKKLDSYFQRDKIKRRKSNYNNSIFAFFNTSST